MPLKRGERTAYYFIFVYNHHEIYIFNSFFYAVLLYLLWMKFLCSLLVFFFFMRTHNLYSKALMFAHNISSPVQWSNPIFSRWTKSTPALHFSCLRSRFTQEKTIHSFMATLTNGYFEFKSKNVLTFGSQITYWCWKWLMLLLVHLLHWKWVGRSSRL